MSNALQCIIVLKACEYFWTIVRFTRTTGTREAEQRCSQRARKSRLKPLRVAAQTEIFFLFVAAAYLLFRCCCFWLWWLSMWGGVLCWTWTINRVPLIFDLLNYCSILSYKGAIDCEWSFLERAHPPHTRFKSLTLKLVVSFWFLSV